MVLYLQEYLEKSKYSYVTKLNYYEKLPKYIHEMTAEELIAHEKRNGIRTFYIQKSIINAYLKWLITTKKVDASNLYFELNKLNTSNDDSGFIGFCDFNDLQMAIQQSEYDLEVAEMNKDFNGLYAAFYLEWLGVLPASIISVKLDDVTDMGRQVFIPAEKRTIEVDNETIVNYFWKYKNTKGRFRDARSIKESPYRQNTFYRTIDDVEINIKTIYNIRRIFVQATEDIRFAKKRIYYSGRYNALYEYELNNNKELDNSDSDTIKKIFNSELSNNVIGTILRDYKIYKKARIEAIK